MSKEFCNSFVHSSLLDVYPVTEEIQAGKDICSGWLYDS